MPRWGWVRWRQSLRTSRSHPSWCTWTSGRTGWGCWPGSRRLREPLEAAPTWGCRTFPWSRSWRRCARPWGCTSGPWSSRRLSGPGCPRTRLRTPPPSVGRPRCPRSSLCSLEGTEQCFVFKIECVLFKTECLLIITAFLNGKVEWCYLCQWAGSPNLIENFGEAGCHQTSQRNVLFEVRTSRPLSYIAVRYFTHWVNFSFSKFCLAKLNTHC